MNLTNQGQQFGALAIGSAAAALKMRRPCHRL